MTNKSEVIKYCKDIKSGAIKAGRYTKKAIERFLKDLEREKQEDFPYFMDWPAVDEVISFAESLKIPDIPSEDKLLVLLPWMKFVYANVWGWKHKHNAAIRRFKTAYVEVARKNSKTTSILFPFILYDFLTTDASESYFVSKDSAQSEKTYKELQQIIKQNEDLAKATNMTVNAISYLSSRITFFCEDSKGIDSYKNSFTVIDEFHAYDSDRVVTAFRYGGRARVNNTIVIITSAGISTEGPCYQENEKAKKVLDCVIDDETYFTVIYSYDQRDKWDDPANFIKANPSLGPILKEETLMQDLKDALVTPSHQADFKAKTCGFWTNSLSYWLPIDPLESTAKQWHEKLEGYPKAGAIDLAMVNDLTVLTIATQIGDRIQLNHHIYLPEDTCKKLSHENLQIKKWIDAGYIIPLPGATVDYPHLYELWSEIIEEHKLTAIAYDRWHSNELIKKIETDLPHLTLVPFDQSIKSFSNPTKRFEKLVLDKKIIDPNPVAHWCIGNVLIKPDNNGNYKPLKKYASSDSKIDTVITSIMAIDLLYNVRAQATQVYSFEEVLALI